MNPWRGRLGLRAGPVPLRGWPASGDLCRLRLRVLLLFQATVQLEGGKLVVDFPNYHQTSEIVGGKLVEVSVLVDPGRTDVFFCSQPWPPRGRPLGSWLYKNFLCVRPCALVEIHNNPVRRDFCPHFKDKETEAWGTKWSSGGHTAFTTEMGFVTLAPTLSDP